jgi:hypothetical protein
MLSLLSLVILRFFRDIITVPNEHKHEAIELGLIGGKLTAEERKNLLRSFHEFMSREISEQYIKNITR